jgi:hypothetical protein
MVELSPWRERGGRANAADRPGSSRRRTSGALVAALIGVPLLVSVSPASAEATSVAKAPTLVTRSRPKPPQLPRNFNGKGRYYVPSLHVNVPFTWKAKHGNVRMVAGGPGQKIWFTNVIYRGSFYTHTYRWPTPIPDVKCTPVKGLDLNAFNKAFALAHYVGPEILQNRPWRWVQHWRLSGTLGPIPVTSSDLYVDQRSRTTWWQVLHFGLQNVYAPDQDEWIKMQTWSHKPGNVTLPQACR